MSTNLRYEILANKYRPKSLEDVIGQDVVVKILTNSFNKNSLHHCYLFHGIFGGGKTTVARILAAMENCKDLQDKINPCGVCDNCKSILSGKSSDVKEFDAASNRSIDDIREMKEKMWEYPLICKKKYYILDEVQSLGNIAAEAALKMIEEPPPHVRFILCTTDINSIIDTIQSRCMDLEFKPIQWNNIFDNLIRICKKEEISYDEESLRLIGKRSNSSVRNSIKILEKVISYSDSNTITLDNTLKVLGESTENLYQELINSILDMNLAKAITTCNALSISSDNSEQVVVGLMDYLDKILITRICSSNSENFGLSSDDVKRYQLISSRTRPLLISRFLGLLVDLKKAFEVNLNATLFLRKWAIDAVVEVARLKEGENKTKPTANN